MSVKSMSAGDRATPPAPTPLHPPRRQRSKVLVLVGVVLAAVCAAGTVAVFRPTSETISAVGVASPVRFGEVVTEAALREVEVHPTAGLEPIAWEDRSAIVGKSATSDLVVGNLVTRAQVGGQPLPRADQQLVGVPFKAGQMPAAAPAPRWPVLLASAESDGWQPIRATVLRVGVTEPNGSCVVDVVVAAADGPRLAAKAAASAVVLIMLPMGAG
ncbi:SAF domain-containing protein [Amycolatopsis nivea]